MRSKKWIPNILNWTRKDARSLRKRAPFSKLRSNARASSRRNRSCERANFVPGSYWLSSPDAKDYFAEHVALLNALVRLGGLFEGKFRGDRHLQVRFLHGVVHLFEFASAHFVVVGDDLQAPALFECRLDAIWISEPTALTKYVEAARNRVAAPQNEHGVDAFGCESERCFDEIIARAVHRQIGAQTLHKSHTIPSRCHSQNLCSPLLGELNGQSAHGTRRAGNHDVLASVNVEVVADSLTRR